MAKKEKVIPRKSTLGMSWDELYQDKVDWHDNYDMRVYGTPTRDFEIDEQVGLGNLNNVRIVHRYDNSGIYAIESNSLKSRDDIRNNVVATRERRIVKWVDIHKLEPNLDSSFVSEMYRRPPFINSSFDSIIHLFTHAGMVMDTRFQRSYVWDDLDREALLDTIFNQGVIGSFIFARLSGYKFKDNIDLEEYATIDGNLIEIRKCDNNCISVIDGQQRLTTLLNFYLNRFKYKGYYFYELSGKDHYTFLNTPVSYAMMDESDGYTLKNWVWLFLQANKGVSQSRKHLAKMEEYYKGL